MSKPMPLRPDQSEAVIDKLTKMFNLPEYTKYLKIEWSFDKHIEIECKSFLDDQMPVLDKAKQKIYCLRHRETGELHKSNGLPVLLLAGQADKWSTNIWKTEIYTGHES